MFDHGHDYEMAVDKIVLRGLSGGPVLDKQKKVVGVIVSSIGNILRVIKLSKLKKLQRGLIGLDCSKLSLSSCIELAKRS